jgi:hypothetical protein
MGGGVGIGGADDSMDEPECAACLATVSGSLHRLEAIRRPSGRT